MYPCPTKISDLRNICIKSQQVTVFLMLGPSCMLGSLVPRPPRNEASLHAGSIIMRSHINDDVMGIKGRLVTYKDCINRHVIVVRLIIIAAKRCPMHLERG